MIKYFKNAFKITNENIILTTPLVLFLFLLSIYLSVAKNLQENVSSAILLLCTILFMLSAFFAGWLFMVKKAILLSKQTFVEEEEKAKASFNLIKEIPSGIGEYFLSFFGGIIIYIALFVFILFAAHQVGMHFIGKIGISLSELKIAFSSAVAMKSLVSSLTTQELQKLNAWNMLFLAVISVFSFITMFWSAQIVFKTKNPLSALFKSINFTFKNLLSSLILFIYISVVNFAVSLLNAYATLNPIIYFVSMLVYFYFLVYVVVLVFLYYDEQSNKIVEKSNCDCGTDCVGQDQVSDSEGEDS